MVIALAALLLACPSVEAKKPGKTPKQVVDDRSQHILEPEKLPQDFKDMGMREYHQTDRHTVSVFKDRVEFHQLPPEIYLGKRGLTDGARPVSLFEFKPLKVLRFASPFDVRSAGNSLLCTHPTPPRLSSRGTEDFCGVLSPQGEVLFEFPFEQRLPYDMLQILGMSADGLYAEVFVGTFVASQDDRRFAIVEPREILGWHYPDRLKRFDGPWKEGPPRDARKAMDWVLKGFAARSARP